MNKTLGDILAEAHPGSVEIDGVVITGKTTKQAGNGSTFYDCTISDGRGSCRLCIWLEDGDTPHVEVGSYCKFTGKVVPKNYAFFSVQSKSFQLVSKEEALASSSFRDELEKVKFSAENDIELMSSKLVDYIDSLACSTQMREFLLILSSPSYLGVLDEAPAAKTVHQAYKGGLLEHTFEILDLAMSIMKSDICRDIDKAVVIGSILLHDVGKTETYKFNSDRSIDRTEADTAYGHVFLSGLILERLIVKLESESRVILSEREKDHLFHCVIAHSGRKEWGSPVEPATKEAFLVHSLDNISGKFGIIDSTDHGTYSKWTNNIVLKW